MMATKKLFQDTFNGLRICWMILTAGVCLLALPGTATSSRVHNRMVFVAIDVPSSSLALEKLTVQFWPDLIHQSRLNEAIVLEIAAVQNRYSFTLPPITHPGRIVVQNSTLGEILSVDLVEPGDSIIATISQTSSGEFTGSFSGRGSSKYNFVREINLNVATSWQYVNGWKDLELETDPGEMVKKKDSLIAHYSRTITARQNICSSVKKIIEKDIASVLNLKAMKSLAYDYAKAEGEKKLVYGRILDELLSFRYKTFQDASASSTATIEFHHDQAKIKLIKITDANFHSDNLVHTQKINFRMVYDELKRSFSGALREQLLAYCITNFTTIGIFFGGADAEDYTACMRDALKTVTEPFRKHVISKQLSAHGKGMPAFDFSLPDSTGNIVHLRDLRNKVVFIDMWSNPCGGCKKFRKEFDRVVYPHLKDDSRLVVVSINLNEERSKWMKGVAIYSHPDFVNLTVGEQGFNHPMVQHYNISAIPQLLLVDKAGKIVSTTVPFTNRYDDLLKLIQSELER